MTADELEALDDLYFEEFLCDAYAGINRAFASGDAKAGRYTDTVRNVAAERQGMGYGAGGMPGGGFIRYSTDEIAREITQGKTLREQLHEAYDTAEAKERRYVYVGRFTEGFKKAVAEYVKVEDYPIVMNYRDAYLAMAEKETGRYLGEGINYHDLGEEGLLEAFQAMQDPEYILKGKNGGDKVELILSFTDRKGRMCIAPIVLNTVTQNGKKFYSAHVVLSVYGRSRAEGYIRRAEAEGRVIYKKSEDKTQGMPQVQYERDINVSSSEEDKITRTGEDVKPQNEAGGKYSIDEGGVPETRFSVEDSMKVDILDERNITRYRTEVQHALDGTMPSGQRILLGRTPSLLVKYGIHDGAVYMPQTAVRKAAYGKEVSGGKHGLGEGVIYELLQELADPIAITGNTSAHEAKGENSVVVWTGWATKDGDSIIVPVRVATNAATGETFATISTVFDVNNEAYLKDLLREGNVLYTKNNESIDQLLSQRR